jgi:hypothetical protein
MRRWVVGAVGGLVAVAAGGAAALLSGVPDRVWVRFEAGGTPLVAREPEGDDLLGPGSGWGLMGPDPSSHHGPEPRVTFCSPSSAKVQAVHRTLRLPHRTAWYWKSGRAAAGASGSWLEYGRVVGDYLHRVGTAPAERCFAVTLLADGSIASRPGAAWTRDGDRLVLTWPDAAAPGGAWRDECELSEDGNSYEGVNQQGTKVTGEPYPGCG